MSPLSNLLLLTVQLVGSSGELLDNMTISFETLDTCFCYGYCGCAVSKPWSQYDAIKCWNRTRFYLCVTDAT